MAQLERAQNNPTAARAWLETALQYVEGLRTNVGSKELRALFFARKQDYFESYIDLLMQQHQAQPAAHFDRLAWQANERARARSLLDLLAASQADIQRGAPLELLTRQQQLSQQIVGQTDRLYRLKNSKAAADQLAASERELRALTTEYEQVQAQIRQRSPHYAALTQPQPVTLAQLQALLDKQTILLQYALGPERSYLWVVTPQTLTSYVLPGRAEIEAAATNVYELLTAPQPRPGEPFAQRVTRSKTAAAQWPAAAAQLSQMILAPAAAQLGTKRLVIVPDGALHAVPFAALPEPVVGGRWPVAGKNVASGQEAVVGKNAIANRPPTTGHRPLILNHEIAYIPSASVLAAQRNERKPSSAAQIPLAIFADPVFTADDFRVTGQAAPQPANVALAPQVTRGLAGASWLREEITLPRLQFSRREAEAIARLLPPGKAARAFDFQANRDEALKPDWQRARILHFATHTLLDDQHPALSGIVLSLVNPDGSPRPGFLQLHDLYNLDLRAELVVLSACRTARGQELRGEGIVGLTRGFFYSGAQRVVSSLWNIDDNATAQLMEEFYRAMWEDDLRPAAALRKAQLKLWQQRRAPYYWSAFVLHGDWQ